MTFNFRGERAIDFEGLTLRQAREYAEKDKHLIPYEIKEPNGTVTFMQAEVRSSEIVWTPDDA